MKHRQRPLSDWTCVLAALAVCLRCLAPAQTNMIVAGDHFLQPDTANQKIEILVNSRGSVQGLNFIARVADGGPEAGGSIRGPAITEVDLVTGTLFSDNHSVQGNPESAPQLAMRTITTSSGTVPARAGLLATLTIDTRGLGSGRWLLALEDPPRDNLDAKTDFAGMPVTLVSGSLTILAPPILTSMKVLSNGASQFTFTNTPGASFTLLCATNLSQPLSNWATNTSAPVETPPGTYLFTDPEATNYPQRFYRVRWP